MATDDSVRPRFSGLGRLLALFTSAVTAAFVRVREGVAGFISMRTLAAGLFFLFFLHLFGLISIPFWPFTTKGKIYVDSPEVYTRERLVNDRYDQDYWLRERLKRLDDPEKLQLVTAEAFESKSGGTGQGAAKREEGKEDAKNGDSAKWQKDKGDAKEHGGGDSPEGAIRASRLSFEQEFRVASGIRDMIRQQVLENMLDDRHDLTGNSVFGLKFDTTVIPGNNTRRRAFVHVALSIDDLFRVQGNGENGPGEHVKGYVASRVEARNGIRHRRDVRETLRRFKKQEGYYQDWLTDIERRLNRAEDSVYETMDDCPLKGGRDVHDRLTGRTLGVVLGVPEEMFWRLNSLNTRSPEAGTLSVARSGRAPEPVRQGFVRLPDPWAKFFTIKREQFYLPNKKNDGSCDYRVWFSVFKLDELLIMVPSVSAKTEPSGLEELWNRFLSTWTPGNGENQRDEVSSADPQGEEKCKEERKRECNKACEDELDENEHSKCLGECEKEGLVPLGGSEEGKWEVMVTSWDYDLRQSRFEDQEWSKYKLTSEVIDELIRADKELRGEPMDTGPREDEKCREILVPSGLFNFVEHLSELDAYSYAIFPKNDMVGVFAETLAQLSAATPVSGFFDFTGRLRETTTASLLVGYGDGGASGPSEEDERDGVGRSIDFGWVISARGDMEPTQKSQLALASVPAWTETLDLRVSVGWLDRNGAPEIDQDSSFDLSIAVPPNLEVFDSIFREDAHVTLGPSIRDNEMDRAIYVRAGQEANILIPGSRLWRSASVTLGAQMAKRITVLPNMEAIIAEFDEVEPPYALFNPETDASTDHSTDRKKGEKKCKEKIEKIQSRELYTREVRLRVWTSEGHIEADRPVCVIYDPKEVLLKPAKGNKSRNAEKQVRSKGT